MTPERTQPIRVTVKRDSVYVDGTPVTLQEEQRIRDLVKDEDRIKEEIYGKTKTSR